MQGTSYEVSKLNIGLPFCWKFSFLKMFSLPYSSTLHLFCLLDSAQGPWCAVIAYDACVRLSLHLWAKGCIEAPVFLENECELLRNAFG